MKYSFSVTTKTALRKLTRVTVSATTQHVYCINVGNDTDCYVYDSADKTTKDNDDTVIVSKEKGLRFRKLKPFEREDIAVVAPTVYKNEAQSFTANCPEGSTGSKMVMIAAGQFESNVSLQDANNNALAEATKQAKAGLVCVPVVKPIPDPKPATGKRIEGFSTFTATGSMEAGSDILILSQPIGELNDMVAVFIGGEEGQGKRSTVGVGKYYPNKIYPSLQEMNADKTQPHGTWVGVIGAKGLFRYDADKKAYWDASAEQPLFDTIVPLSLVDATIKEFLNPEKTKVRLDKTAFVSTKDATVVIDSTNVLINYVKKQKSKSIDFKALGFGEGDTLYFRREKWEGQEWIDGYGWFYAKDITIDGNGVLFNSIPGTFPATFSVEYGNGGSFNIINATIRQSGKYEGMGFPNQSRFGTPQSTEDWENPWLYCAAVDGAIEKSIAEKTVVINPLAYGFRGSTLLAKNCGVIVERVALTTYNGFLFLCNTEDCWVDSEHLIRAGEIEAWNGYVRNFKARNGIFAFNSCLSADVKGLYLTFTKDAAVHNPAVLDNPAIEIHPHIKGAANNIVIEGVNIDCQDYLSPQGGLIRDFSIKEHVDGLVIRNVNINKPPSLFKYGPNGYASSLACDSDNVLVEDFTTNVKMGYGFGKEGLTNSHDNTCISMRGKGCTLRRVKAESAVVAQDTIVEDCYFTFGFTRI